MENFSIISVDNVKESYKMVNYLCELGHRKLYVLLLHQVKKTLKTQARRLYKSIKNGISEDKNLIRYLVDDSIETYSMNYEYQ